MPTARGEEILFDSGYETQVGEAKHLPSKVAKLLVQAQTLAGGSASVCQSLLGEVQEGEGVQDVRLPAAIAERIEA